ncbi:ubiA prenyltransferase domain-containing protein 1-like [Actinia tenebrosa]|uniref:UbiA prenyltransferase domain-containing protein 1-like n=1 Tax=Actinia tenebrosa TaxID=6105 RepID=A0A6P8HP50_ACTTE|nr:ubiA prenyltransferase domain-containing protein 1-like [Actinia tenebrosa]
MLSLKKEDYDSTSFIKKMKSYIICLRPWSFTASFMSVLLGTAMAWKSRENFDLLRLMLTLLAVLATHAAGNLVNTLFDYKNGIDTTTSDDKTLVKKTLTPREVRILIYICYEVAIASYIVICLGYPSISPMKIFPTFLTGMAASFIYTGSIGLKYIALGDLVVFIAFGPVITLFTYAVQTGELSMQCVSMALPLAFHTEAILHGNNIRDLETDKNAGIVTMAILLGMKNARLVYTLLLILPYIMISFMAPFHSAFLLFPLLSLPLACRLNFDCYHGNLQEIPQKTAMVNLVFGILYVCGLALAK